MGLPLALLYLVDQALEKIQVNFRCHCLLTRRQMAAEAGGRERLTMPLPALRKGTWGWVEDPELKFDIQGIPATGKISDETTLLREGRLVLLDPFREEKK